MALLYVNIFEKHDRPNLMKESSWKGELLTRDKGCMLLVFANGLLSVEPSPYVSTWSQPPPVKGRVKKLPLFSSNLLLSLPLRALVVMCEIHSYNQSLLLNLFLKSEIGFGSLFPLDCHSLVGSSWCTKILHIFCTRSLKQITSPGVLQCTVSVMLCTVMGKHLCDSCRTISRSPITATQTHPIQIINYLPPNPPTFLSALKS